MSKKIIFTDRSNELLNSYLKDISKYKILESSEIAKLILEAQEGNEKSKNKVVQSNLRFVVTIAKQFQHRGIDLMDLIAAGNEGIIKAVDKFDPSRGVTFLSYAVWWIKQAIYKTIYWNSREIRLPMSQQLLVNRILDATNLFLQKNSRNPSSEEISELTGIPTDQIIPDGEIPLEDQVNKIYISKEIHHYLNKLSIREHDILIMYFGLGIEPVPHKTIAAMYGVGTERIRQIKEGALNKLQRRFGNKLKTLW